MMPRIGVAADDIHDESVDRFWVRKMDKVSAVGNDGMWIARMQWDDRIQSSVDLMYRREAGDLTFIKHPVRTRVPAPADPIRICIGTHGHQQSAVRPVQMIQYRDPETGGGQNTSAKQSLWDQIT